MLSNASRRVVALGRGPDWLGVTGRGVKQQERVAGLVSSCSSRRSIVKGSALALGQGREWLEVIGRGLKQEGGASWNARRTICTASVLPAQMHTTASRKSPITALPLPADAHKGSLGEFVEKTGRQMTRRWLEGIRGGLAKCKGALQSWQFERAQQAKMVTMEDYLQYLVSLSDGRLLTKELREDFARLMGFPWFPEAPFPPWLLIFQRLFPESLGYDVRVEKVVGLTYQHDDGRIVEMEDAYLHVRRAALEGDGPVLLIVAGFHGKATDRRESSLAKLTGRIEGTAADLMHSGQARERMVWLAFCGQDFCWGRIQRAGAQPLRAGAGLHVQQAEGQRALLQLAEEVHSLLISRA